MSSVVLQAVSKSYGAYAAVQNLNLEIEQGEFVVLLGPSGCGKTTTLRMIAGFVDPTAGRILLGGKDVTTLPPRNRDIGMVFQNYALFPNMRVRENVAYSLRRRGVSRAQANRRVDELLEMVQLTQYADHRPDELSGGQQQRVSLARALAHTPKVLLMDEPLGALDMKLREQLQEEILRIQKTLGITTIFVTHDQNEAMALADRIVLMREGTIHQEGTADQIYLRPESVFAASFIGKCNHLEATYLGDGVARLTGGVEVAGVAPPEGCHSGEAITIALRPEALRMQPAGQSGDTADVKVLRAIITERRFLGNIVHYRLRTTSDETLLAEGRGSNFDIGSEVELGWDPGDLTLLGKDSDKQE